MITNSDAPPSQAAENTAAEHGFRIVVAWPAVAAEDAAAIRAFWRREGALTDDASMEQRLPQVVMHARAPGGEVAGVCTAVPMTLPRLGQPMYYWRTFVGKQWRSTSLVMAMLKRSCVHLEAYARDRDFPCIGVLLELENDRFRERGLDLRALYFRGARLKPPSKP